MSINRVAFFESIANANWRVDRITSKGTVERKPTRLTNIFCCCLNKPYNERAALQSARKVVLFKLEKFITTPNPTPEHIAVVLRSLNSFDELPGVKEISTEEIIRDLYAKTTLDKLEQVSLAIQTVDQIEEVAFDCSIFRKTTVENLHSYTLNGKGSPNTVLATVEKCNRLFDLLKLPKINISDLNPALEIVRGLFEPVDLNNATTQFESAVQKNYVNIPKGMLTSFVEDMIGSRLPFENPLDERSHAQVLDFSVVVATEVLNRIGQLHPDAEIRPVERSNIALANGKKHVMIGNVDAPMPIPSLSYVSLVALAEKNLWAVDQELCRFKKLSPEADSPMNIIKAELKTRLSKDAYKSEAEYAAVKSVVEFSLKVYNQALRNILRTYTQTSLPFEPLDLNDLLPKEPVISASKRKRTTKR